MIQYIEIVDKWEGYFAFALFSRHGLPTRRYDLIVKARHGNSSIFIEIFVSKFFESETRRRLVYFDIPMYNTFLYVSLFKKIHCKKSPPIFPK
jgi:hypothetical protein